MKKITKYLFFGLALIVAMLTMTACGHEHTWTEATCDTPRTCSECGETEGEALGHDWMEATCESPKTCSRCGKTEGEALEHQWIEASFEAPQTCSLCGATMGEKYDYEIEEYELYYVDEESISTMVKVKEDCGDLLDLEIIGKTTSPNGESMYLVKSTWDEYLEDGSTSTYYSLISYKDGKYNGFKSSWELGAEYSEPDERGYRYGSTCVLKPNSNFDIEVVICNVDSNKYLKEILIYDSQFNKVKEIHPPEGKYNDVWYNIASYNFSIWNISDDSIPAIYYDDDHNEIQVDFKDEECTRIKENGGWSYAEYQFDDVYFVGNDDKWGYVNSAGKELAMYMDASAFNKDGYAFVSNDRKSYDLIDKNFNVVLENAIEGNNMALLTPYYFSVRRDTDQELGELFAYRLAKVNIVGGPGDRQQ